MARVRQAKTVTKLQLTYGDEDVERLELAAKVWELRKLGRSNYKIAVDLKLPVSLVNSMIEISKREFAIQITKAVEEERALDVARADEVIQWAMPLMQAVRVPVVKTNSQGEVYTEEEYKYSLGAAKLLLDAIKTRSELFGYSKTEGSAQTANKDILVWLRNEIPETEKMIQALPSEGKSEGEVLDLSFDETS